MKYTCLFVHLSVRLEICDPAPKITVDRQSLIVDHVFDRQKASSNGNHDPQDVDATTAFTNFKSFSTSLYSFLSLTER